MRRDWNASDIGCVASIGDSLPGVAFYVPGIWAADIDNGTISSSFACLPLLRIAE